MISVKITARSESSGYRILIIALAASLAWHLFCLFAVKIVSSPMPKSSVRFSNVAFLGPILPAISMEVRAEPSSRSFLENRFRNIAGSLFADEEGPIVPTDLRGDDRSIGDANDRRLLAVIDGAISGEKFEPDFPAE